jgi:hypothetical protein
VVFSISSLKYSYCCISLDINIRGPRSGVTELLCSSTTVELPDLWKHNDREQTYSVTPMQTWPNSALLKRKER